METRTQYFTLPHVDDTAPTSPEQIKRDADAYYSLVETQLDDHASLLHLEKALVTNGDVHEYAVAKQKSLAEDLVKLTRHLPHHLALNILIESLSHSLFQEADASHIILEGINKENHKRSPLITGELSLYFIKQQLITHPKDADMLLTNPDLLLMWLDKAPALEISRLFSYFFHRESKYYLAMRDLAQKEYSTDQPGKALLCYTLMCPGRLSVDGAKNISSALQWLNEHEPINKFERTIKSLHACMLASNEAIMNADGCYINLNKLELTNANFESAHLRGASFKNSKFDRGVFVKADLTGALLDKSSMTEADFSGANLSDASMCEVNLSHSLLINAKLINSNLSGADLTYARLYNSDLSSTNLSNANLDHAAFFTRDHFATPASLDAELNRLHAMITGHKQETKLRALIISDLIATTRDHHSVKILKAAYDHPISNQHKDMHTVKAGVNLVLSAYHSFFKPEKTDGPAIYETEEQKRLRMEIELREKLVTAVAPQQRPPYPDKPPTPPHATLSM